MASHTDRLEHLRIASPCPANWERMSGDDRVRYCELCNLHVYNIARMTRKETAALISRTEGRICARLYRRSDGTIITKDCPIGLRALRRRVVRMAGAVFATIMSLAATIAGQRPIQKDKPSCQQQGTATKSSADSTHEAGSISGTIVDPNGAAISGVKIRVNRKAGAEVTASQSNDRGWFQVGGLKSDTYELVFESRGFDSLKLLEVRLVDNCSVTVAAILLPKGASVVVGIVAEEPLLNRDSATDMRVFSGDLIRRLPH